MKFESTYRGGSARSLTHALKGKWYGSYGTACCPAHADTQPSLTITDGPPGRWLLFCHAGCSFGDVLNALRWRGLLEGNGRMPEPDPAEIARAHAEAERLAVKRARQALSIWTEAQPITGTPAETYLRGRAITCNLTDSLRYHPSCWHPSGVTVPAMLAVVEGAERFALHRTYLRPDGSGKADAEPRKAMLGTTAGGHVEVAFAEQGPLVVAEGIETAFSLGCGLLSEFGTIWAALSASGMAGLVLPDKPHRIIIATDGEQTGRAAGHKLAERAAGLGWDVSMHPAPEGVDWNDVLKQVKNRQEEVKGEGK